MKRTLAGAGILVMLVLCAELARPLFGVAKMLLASSNSPSKEVSVGETNMSDVSREAPKVVRVEVRPRGVMKD